MAKIISVYKLSKILKNIKKNKKKISLCHGTFDLIHIGHIDHFEESKKISDLLIVSVTSDKFVLKGPNRPKFKLKDRMRFLSKINTIDYIVESDYETAVEVINNIKPNFYCKGPDYSDNKNDITKNIKKELSAINKVKGKIYYTNTVKHSSSEILNNLSNNDLSKDKNFNQKIRDKINFKKDFEKFSLLNDLKILVIGETIIDEYVFCEAIGKSGKEPVLVVQNKNTEKYLGGAAMIANNISMFTKNVSFISFLGNKKNYDKFVTSNLSKNIKKIFIRKDNSPTIVKKRYIDHINNNKILGVYSINNDIISSKNEQQFENKIKSIIQSFDAVIVADYGHGIITDRIANLISKKSNYLSLNSQINAFNIGYQDINKYHNIDLLLINENELRHQMRDKNSNKEDLAKFLIKKMKIKKIIVTSGKQGATIITKKDNKVIKCPAFTSNVVDKIGSGDTMLSIASLCDINKISDEATLLLGSLAATQSVESIGNSKLINKLLLSKSFEYILK